MNIKSLILSLLILALILPIGIQLFLSIQSGSLKNLANSPFQANSVSAAGGKTLFITPEKIIKLKSDVAQSRQPTKSAYDDLINECNNISSSESGSPPIDMLVPFYYGSTCTDPGHKTALREDAKKSYALALCYQMTGNNSYAETSIRIINNWSTTLKTISTCNGNTEDAPLVLAYFMPNMIFAADLLKNHPSFIETINTAYSNLLTNIVLPISPIDKISGVQCNSKYNNKYADIKYNNWSNWGLVLNMSIGGFTNNDSVYTDAVTKWKRNIAIEIDEFGNLPLEGMRNNCTGDSGVHYTNFGMQGLTVAAEIAYNNGENLFQYVVNGVNKYEKAYKQTALITRDTSKLPFATLSGITPVEKMKYASSWMEIANTHFPGDTNAQFIFDRVGVRPMKSSEVARFATFSHGGQIPETSTPSSAPSILPSPRVSASPILVFPSPSIRAKGRSNKQ